MHLPKHPVLWDPRTTAMASLPKSDSSELHLVVATPEEHIAQQHANSNEWRGALSLSAYLRREQTLFNQALTRDGGITAWQLVYQPAGSSEDARQVVCGCETIRKKAIATKDGVVTDVIAHGVASVFCPKEYRGKGYAGRMMADLGERLKTWQSQGQDNLFSVLYSDIGKVGSLFLIIPTTLAHRCVGFLRCVGMEGVSFVARFSHC